MILRAENIPNRDLIREVAERHGALSVRVFGSFARGDARPDSDLDILVEAGPETTPWFPGGIVADLEEALGRRVDVVTLGGLPPELRDRALQESVSVRRMTGCTSGTNARSASPSAETAFSWEMVVDAHLNSSIRTGTYQESIPLGGLAFGLPSLPSREVYVNVLLGSEGAAGGDSAMMVVCTT